MYPKLKYLVLYFCIKNILGFQNAFGVDNNNKSGGLALFWQDDRHIILKSCSPGHLDTIMTDDNGASWRFMGFYGHPVRNNRSVSWELIRRLTSMFSIPWIIGGDFNEIANVSKKKNGGSNDVTEQWKILLRF